MASSKGPWKTKQSSCVIPGPGHAGTKSQGHGQKQAQGRPCPDPGQRGHSVHPGQVWDLCALRGRGRKPSSLPGTSCRGPSSRKAPGRRVGRLRRHRGPGQPPGQGARGSSSGRTAEVGGGPGKSAGRGPCGPGGGRGRGRGRGRWPGGLPSQLRMLPRWQEALGDAK